jgi:hypothetical protein
MRVCRRPLYGIAGIAGIAVICWARRSLAYRPFDGTDADIAEPGEVELEIGPVGYRREGSARFVVAPAIVANYGFAPDFEAVLEGRQDIQVNTAPPLRQIEDVALSVKSLLRRGSLQQSTGLSVALEVGMLLPGSESPLGTHIGSILSLQLPAITLHLNLANNLFYSMRYEASASLILEGPHSCRLRPVAEVLVERQFGRDELDDGLAVRCGVFRRRCPIRACQRSARGRGSRGLHLGFRAVVKFVTIEGCATFAALGRARQESILPRRTRRWLRRARLASPQSPEEA